VRCVIGGDQRRQSENDRCRRVPHSRFLVHHAWRNGSDQADIAVTRNHRKGSHSHGPVFVGRHFEKSFVDP
jgi:hypothetical protein